MKNKKGFVGDYMLYIVMLFVIAIGLLTVYYVATTINTAWQDTPNLTDRSKTIMSRFTGRFVGVWNNFYLFLVIGFAIVTIVLAFALRSHPVFALFTVFLLIIMAIVSVFLANAYFDIARTAPFDTFVQDFNMLHWLAQHIPQIVVVFGFIFVIILYAKTKGQDVTGF